MDRRQFVTITLATLAQLSFGEPKPSGIEPEIAGLEKSVSGRLGVSILDTGTGQRVSHRGDERFPMCSTFKLLAVGAVLARVDTGKDSLDRQIGFTKADLVPYSPVTEKHAGGAMSLAELCEAAITLSDNTAANLILSTLGGPAGTTAFARTLGDSKTRLDRNEPSLNESVPGDERDTTTPDAMASDLRALALGDALAPSSRDRLTQWLLGSKTGDDRLRAGLPRDWKIGDKTGTGQHGSTNDIAVIWPPNRKPLIVAVYLTDTAAPAQRRNALIASVARLVAGV